MRYKFVHKTEPYTKVLNHRNVIGPNQRWAGKRDVFISVAGEDINLNKEKANVKMAEWINGDLIVLRKGVYVVTCHSAHEFHVYIDKGVQA